MVGLDIEVSSVYDGPGFPFPHDNIISVCISTRFLGKNLGFIDQAVCLQVPVYDGSPNEWSERPNARVIACSSQKDIVRRSLEVLVGMNPDFVVIHIGYAFDLLHLAMACGDDFDLLSMLCERNLGNTGKTIDWILPIWAWR